MTVEDDVPVPIKETSTIIPAQSEREGNELPLSAGPQWANSPDPISECQRNLSTEEEDGSRSKKRRITRACDLCNRRRVKCDGRQPCSRCGSQDVCVYERAVFKRGKPSRSAIIERNKKIDEDEHHFGGDTRSDPTRTEHAIAVPEETGSPIPPPEMETPRSPSKLDCFVPHSSATTHRVSVDRTSTHTQKSSFGDRLWPEFLAEPSLAHVGLSKGPRASLSGPQELLNVPKESMNALNEPLGAPAIDTQQIRRLNDQLFRTPEYPNSINHHDGQSDFYTVHDAALGPGPSTHINTNPISQTARFPVIKTVMPFILSFLTESQASSLLELYFSSHFITNMHPVCKHVHAFIFRKASVLSQDNPRKCSPALLASMLWVAAETGGSDIVAWSHSKRTDVCRRLRVLTIKLLRPMVHLDLGCSHDARRMSETRDTSNAFPEPLAQSSGTLDDVVTYIHIAAITSASEEKAMSMRWWHAAFALGRELRLNKEPLSEGAASALPGVSPTAQDPSMLAFENDPWFGLNSFDYSTSLAQFLEGGQEMSGLDSELPVCTNPSQGEEALEERRRTWWLLYIQDRHLALCYNRQNALLDAECEDLLLPLDEATYQSGAFLYDPSLLLQRPRFPSFECTGHNIFGWFLPLMTIVGTILDYHHLKNHHTLGMSCSNSKQAEDIETQILGHLNTYSRSLIPFEKTSTMTVDSSTSQDAHHTATVVAYARHVIDVSRVLLAGKWDPVSLFDDRDMFMATASFTTTIRNAISAAEHINRILDVDPDLSFVPYFLGIQLLQGSLPLLLIVDRLQTETDPNIISACEAVIRATEACVSTLDTEYQRNYRQILRSAVSQARGRYVPQKENQFRRHTVLALYRWNKGGTGLAL